VDRLETILETPEYAEWHYRIKKMNKTRAVVGNILLRQPILNNDTMELKFLRKQGMYLETLAHNTLGQWCPTFFAPRHTNRPNFQKIRYL